MKGNSIFKNPALIGYLAKKIQVEYPNRQVGKTYIQKMIYLLNRNDVVDFNYSMYHYGPYSSEVSGELNFAQNTGIVQVKWIDDKGYFIESTSKLNAIELSIIATGFFLKDNFGVSDSELVNVIHQFKPDHTVEFIENILRRAGNS